METKDVDQAVRDQAAEIADQFLLRTDFWAWMMAELKDNGMIRTEDGRLYLLFGAEEAGMEFLVQAEPELKMESFVFNGWPEPADD